MCGNSALFYCAKTVCAPVLGSDWSSNKRRLFFVFFGCLFALCSFLNNCVENSGRHTFEQRFEMWKKNIPFLFKMCSRIGCIAAETLNDTFDRVDNPPINLPSSSYACSPGGNKELIKNHSRFSKAPRYLSPYLRHQELPQARRS